METLRSQKGPSPLDAEFKSIEPSEAPIAQPTFAPSVCTKLWRWVPVRALAPRHRARIALHLLQLPPHDLYLRFGYAASNSQVTRYVDTLDFERDEVFGIFNRHLELVAMAHVAYAPPSVRGNNPILAEFGVSVLPSARGRGYGTHLFDHAVLHARNRGVSALFIHSLSSNDAMLKIARRAGAIVKRNASESEAWLKLPQDSIASHFEEALVEQAAELNYQVKVHAKGLQERLGSATYHVSQVSDPVNTPRDRPN